MQKEFDDMCIRFDTIRSVTEGQRDGQTDGQIIIIIIIIDLLKRHCDLHSQYAEARRKRTVSPKNVPTNLASRFAQIMDL